MTVYVALTDGLGKMMVHLRMIDVDEERAPVWEADNEIEFDDPRMVVEMVFQRQRVELDHPGEYRLQVFAAEEFILERRVLVLQGGNFPPKNKHLIA